MTDKRLHPASALVPLMLIVACNGEAAEEAQAPSGEVLEGTISDAMLPDDRLTSEAPLEDPEAFAEAQQQAAEQTAGAAAGPAAAAASPSAAEETEAAPAADAPDNAE